MHNALLRSARGGLSHSHGNKHRKFGEVRTCGSRQRDMLIRILCCLISGGVIITDGGSKERIPRVQPCGPQGTSASALPTQANCHNMVHRHTNMPITTFCSLIRGGVIITSSTALRSPWYLITCIAHSSRLSSRGTQTRSCFNLPTRNS